MGTRLAFFAFALIGSPLIVWLFHETIYDASDRGVWMWAAGLPALLTILVGAVLRRALWEFIVGAALSVGITIASLIITLLVACSGMNDCL